MVFFIWDVGKNFWFCWWNLNRFTHTVVIFDYILDFCNITSKQKGIILLQKKNNVKVWLIGMITRPELKQNVKIKIWVKDQKKSIFKENYWFKGDKGICNSLIFRNILNLKNEKWSIPYYESRFIRLLQEEILLILSFSWKNYLFYLLEKSRFLMK